MRKFLATVVCAGALVACGGGDDGSTTSTDPFPATQISIGTLVTGSIGSLEERDYYKFVVPTGGATVRFQTFDGTGETCDPIEPYEVDPRIWVYNSAGSLVDIQCQPANSAVPCQFSDYETCKCSDDGSPLSPGYCEDFTMTLSGGILYVAVGGWEPLPFTYTLKVTIP